MLIAAVGAHLGHQDHPVALALQRLAEPLLALPVVIIPSVVEEVDTGVDGFVYNPLRLVEVLRRPEVITANPENGGLQSRASPGTLRYVCAGVRVLIRLRHQ